MSEVVSLTLAVTLPLRHFFVVFSRSRAKLYEVQNDSEKGVKLFCRSNSEAFL